jgi:hypothetical protein
MSYTFTITCNTAEEIERLLAALRDDADHATATAVQPAVQSAAVQGDTGGDVPTSVDAPKRRGRPPREKTPEPAQQSETFEEVEQPPQVNVTLDDARAALRGLQSRAGEDDMATPIGVLKEFGASRISEVKAEDYAAFIVACEKAA